MQQTVINEEIPLQCYIFYKLALSCFCEKWNRIIHEQTFQVSPPFLFSISSLPGLQVVVQTILQSVPGIFLALFTSILSLV